MGLFKTKSDENWKINYIKEFNEMRAEYEKKIPGIVRKDNVYGLQFHPEKSGEVGENILKAYKELIVK